MGSSSGSKEIFFFSKCVLCAINAADSDEHILPESMGGRLKWRMLCTSCNSRVGRNLIAQLKKDPAVVLAIDALRASLGEEVLQGRRLVTKGPDEMPLVIERRKGSDQVRTRKATDGSLLADNSNAPRIIEGMLSAVATPEEISDFLEALEAAAENEVVDSGKGIAVVSRPVDSIEPDLSSATVDDRAFGIIALGYMAMLVGDAIFASYFDAIREWIQDGKQRSEIRIERFVTRKYVPEHVLAGRQEGEEFVVQIVLFGGVVTNVVFPQLQINGNHPVYIEDLKEGQSLLAESLQEAEEGKLFQLRGPEIVVDAQDGPDSA